MENQLLKDTAGVVGAILVVLAIVFGLVVASMAIFEWGFFPPGPPSPHSYVHDRGGAAKVKHSLPTTKIVPLTSWSDPNFANDNTQINTRFVKINNNCFLETDDGDDYAIVYADCP